MKVALIGGGSFSTPALFSTLSEARLTGSEFVLIGRTPARLAAVARAAKLLSGNNPPQVTFCACTAATAQDALAGSDVVLLQIRVGGMHDRAFDETFPLEFGLCGDEGLGPGGLSSAWRSWPQIQLWLSAIAEFSPQALVLMVSSPVGILTRAARTCFPSLLCLGICEVPFVCLRDICDSISADISTVSFGFLGVNHLGWLYEVRAHERNLVAEWAELPTRSGFPSASLIADWGGVPTKFLRFHFETESALAAQRAASEPRACALQRMQATAQVAFEAGSLVAIHQAIAQRDTPWYSDSIAPLLLALHNGHGDRPFFLSAANDGYAAAFARDDILEIPYFVKDQILSRVLPSTDAPTAITSLVQDFCRYERIATEAVLTRTVSLLESALAVHPWVTELTERDALLASSLARAIDTHYQTGSKSTYA